MPDFDYSEKELTNYFEDRRSRRAGAASGNGHGVPPKSDKSGGQSETEKKRQAFRALAVVLALIVLPTLAGLLYMATLADELPSLEQLEKPTLHLATVAYTADGKELQRYARQNRSWVSYDEMSPNVVRALVATEDHRFYDHWGVDLFRTFSSVVQTVLGDRQGGSSITQQLARNLFNEQIGREVSVGRKLKEMVTAVQLERRYTKREIIEMYLNTVEFGNNAFGIEAASRTFFGTTPAELDQLQAATLVGMLKAITYYNPIRNPENAQQRRNVVLRQMVKNGELDASFYEENKDEPVVTEYRSSEITASRAPYFAEYVRNWMNDWAARNGYDVYSDGLRVYTTIDSRLQELARLAVEEQADNLQKVVDYEWSRPTNYFLGTSVEAYTSRTDYEPFAHYWKEQADFEIDFIRESDRYRTLRSEGTDPADALAQLRGDTAFMDSLHAVKTRLEAGLVSLDPNTGHVKAWVGGRDLAVDWYDHVALAVRQPGSTFKPFVYTAAIDNGYSPYHMLVDSTFTYVDVVGNEWAPTNSGFAGTGELMTLRDGLAHSKNTITGRLVLMVSPAQVAFYARRMGIQSRLEEVPSLALGTSDVTLLEMTSAYGTLASGGLRHDPIVVTRIEDQNGNLLYEIEPTPHEALSEKTAYTVVDMLRAVVVEGTGRRVNSQFGLGKFDLAGKTGTTQNSADGWFMLMHPKLVTGAWVGFNDRRVAFRSDWWGQGAHNALFVAADFFKRATEDEDLDIKPTQRFPTPSDYGLPSGPLVQGEGRQEILDKKDRDEKGRVGW